jgi:hypothetical protein
MATAPKWMMSWLLCLADDEAYKSALGVQVTLLCSGPLPLPREDHAISRALLGRLQKYRLAAF